MQGQVPYVHPWQEYTITTYHNKLSVSLLLLLIRLLLLLLLCSFFFFTILCTFYFFLFLLLVFLFLLSVFFCLIFLLVCFCHVLGLLEFGCWLLLLLLCQLPAAVVCGESLVFCFCFRCNGDTAPRSMLSVCPCSYGW